MAWGTSITKYGVCGNFKFECHTLIDVKATRSLVRPKTMSQVHFVASTNETDNADVFAAQTLAWTGTADGNTVNELVDSSEVFDPELDGTQAFNNTDGLTSFVTYKDADELYCNKKGNAFDLCPDGNEDYVIYSERVVQVIAVSANDDGTLLIIGR